MAVARAAAGDTDDTAEQGEQDRLGEELRADMASGGAQRAAQADLGAAFEDRDDHDVGDAYRTDKQRDGTETQEQAVERALRVGPGDQSSRGLAHVDLVGRSRGWPWRPSTPDGMHLAG